MPGSSESNGRNGSKNAAEFGHNIDIVARLQIINGRMLHSGTLTNHFPHLQSTALVCRCLLICLLVNTK